MPGAPCRMAGARRRPSLLAERSATRWWRPMAAAASACAFACSSSRSVSDVFVATNAVGRFADRLNIDRSGRMLPQPGDLAHQLAVAANAILLDHQGVFRPDADRL